MFILNFISRSASNYMHSFLWWPGNNIFLCNECCDYACEVSKSFGVATVWDAARCDAASTLVVASLQVMAHSCLTYGCIFYVVTFLIAFMFTEHRYATESGKGGTAYMYYRVGTYSTIYHTVHTYPYIRTYRCKCRYLPTWSLFLACYMRCLDLFNKTRA